MENELIYKEIVEGNGKKKEKKKEGWNVVDVLCRLSPTLHPR